MKSPYIAKTIALVTFSLAAAACTESRNDDPSMGGEGTLAADASSPGGRSGGGGGSGGTGGTGN